MRDTKMVYQWTVPIFPVDAQLAGKELEQIEKRRGCLRPQYVVEESRPEGAVLHNCFEWDDAVAAEKYRCDQAKEMLRHIVAVQIGDVEPKCPVRAFVSFKEGNAFVPINTVLSTPGLSERMLKMALKELKSFHRKYASLQALSELLAAIDNTLGQFYTENEVS